MKSYLVDGPIMLTLERRKPMIERMAKDLVQHVENLVCDRDAVRILLSKGYRTVDVAILAGEARMVAYQEIVAREMSEP
jgi:hypothetical protein